MCLSLYTDANPIIPRSFLTNLVNKFKHTAGFAHPRQQQNHHTRNHHIYGSPLQGLSHFTMGAILGKCFAQAQVL